MNEQARSLGRSVVAGARIGAAVWLLFAACEYGLWRLAPQFSRSYCSDASLAWNRDLLFFALYPAIGAAAGIIFACACRFLRARSTWLQTADDEVLVGVLSLIGVALATSAGVAVQIELRGLGRALCVAPLIVAIGLSALAISIARGSRSGLAGSPWLIVVLLLAVPWLTTRPGIGIDPRIPIYGCALLYLMLVGALALREWMTRRPEVTEPTLPPRPGSSRRWLLTAAASAGAVVTAAVFLDSAAYVPAPRPEGSTVDATHPNVILIVLDTARAENFSLYGYPHNTTPNIGRFAREATVYTHAISASNYTLSSHASLFTGLMATSHGAHPTDPADRHRVSGEPGLANGFVTLAEILAKRGYVTAASMANYLFLSQGYNLDQGFERFAVLSYRCAAPSPRPLFRRLLAGASGQPDETTSATPYHNAAQVNEDAFHLLDRLARRNQRFFLFLNYMDVHFPYAPPAPFDALFPGKGAPIDRDAYFDLRNAVLRGDRTVTEAERRHLLSQYDGALAYLDGEIGRLLGELKREGVYDNSLIIITSDHGEAFGEKGYIEHGTSLYQDQVHVPLIVKYPRGGRRGVVEEYVSGVDVMPTVLDVIGSKPPTEIQGKSLRLMDVPSRAIITESFPRETFQHFGPRFQRVERAIFEGPLKLIGRAGGGPEVYDLRDDPHETRNLYQPDRPEAIALQAKLDAWLAANATHQGGAPVTDPETLERLRSLGYIK